MHSRVKRALLQVVDDTPHRTILVQTGIQTTSFPITFSFYVGARNVITMKDIVGKLRIKDHEGNIMIGGSATMAV